jgi:hypothetical protein
MESCGQKRNQTFASSNIEFSANFFPYQEQARLA